MELRGEAILTQTPVSQEGGDEMTVVSLEDALEPCSIGATLEFGPYDWSAQARRLENLDGWGLSTPISQTPFNTMPTLKQDWSRDH